MPPRSGSCVSISRLRCQTGRPAGVSQVQVSDMMRICSLRHVDPRWTDPGVTVPQPVIPYRYLSSVRLRCSTPLLPDLPPFLRTRFHLANPTQSFRDRSNADRSRPGSMNSSIHFTRSWPWPCFDDNVARGVECGVQRCSWRREARPRRREPDRSRAAL